MTNNFLFYALKFFIFYLVLFFLGRGLYIIFSKEDFLTDAEAVKLGYVSISILDYELLDPNFNSLEFENFINE